jgi:hypothetical protein
VAAPRPLTGNRQPARGTHVTGGGWPSDLHARQPADALQIQTIPAGDRARCPAGSFPATRVSIRERISSIDHDGFSVRLRTTMAAWLPSQALARLVAREHPVSGLAGDRLSVDPTEQEFGPVAGNGAVNGFTAERPLSREGPIHLIPERWRVGVPPRPGRCIVQL